ncbi:MAG: aldehyde dehydrogenase family protein, partial [bacterium]
MSAAPFEVRSPATGEVVGAAPRSGPAEIDRAVRAAKAAQERGAALTVYARESATRKATAAGRAQAPAIGLLMARETGKPLAQSVAEVGASCDLIDFYAAEGPRLEGRIIPTEKAEYRSLVTYRPVGVAALIVPWNYPVALLSWKLGPALAAGCAAVVKPSPVSPLCTIAFAEALAAGGLPPGLIGTVSGEGADVGEALLAHPLVDKVAMTGSTATGKAIMRSFGPSLKRISLELGGHCPALVLPDADPDLVAEVIAYKAFRNMGQSCSSINRVYAHRSIIEAVVAKTVALAAKLTIGDGITDPAVDLGPMATKAGRDK